jgi:hypothetical protein
MSEPTPITPPSPTVAPTKYGGRNELLSRSGKLKEADVDVDGVTYVVRELNGLERAHLISLQAEARINGGKVDLGQYQKQLLLRGLVDPETPEGAREAALTEADLDAVMRNGAGFLDPILDRIEELSGLNVDAQKAAKDFLGGTPSESATSASPES